MRKFLLLALLAVISIGRVVADEITSATALSIASEVFGDATRGGELYVAWDSSSLATTRSGNNPPSYYVVAAESGRGFVVVAGDDVLAPILAYSFDYPAPDVDSMHPALKGWFGYVDSAVRYMRLRNISPDASTAELWAKPSVATESIRLNTARWSQAEPYNRYCPKDGSQLSLTGCTQTAMAEIMHYYRWPERAQGITEAYTTLTKGFEVSARDLNHDYEWGSMLDEYAEGRYNDAQGNAVAMLMADLGHSFKADYAAEATGALPDAVAMYENYGYSPSCHYAMRDYYTEESWNDLMRSEIEANRPVFYSAYTKENFGHAFVLDGVDDSDYFHVNWGWGGVGDGFFELGSLVLDSYVFDSTHWAFLGLHPLRDGEIDNWLYLSAPGISTSATEFFSDEEFFVDGVSIANLSVLDFEGEVRLGVCDINGEFKSWASDAISFSLPAGYATSIIDIVAKVKEDIASGDRLRVFYRSKSSDKWFWMMSAVDGTRWEVVLKYPSIGDTTSLRYDKKSGIITVAFDDNVEAELHLLGESIESGVEHAKGRMIIDTSYLKQGTTYTLYFEREDGEAKIVMFSLNEM